jgi:3-(3-hydroxy-phenyl)propionate hydroxylase
MAKVFETPLYPYERSPDQDQEEPVRHKVIVVGAGPVGLAAAIDLALHNVPVVVLDENDKVSAGSRAICFAKRSLEILDRLGCGEAAVEKGVEWKVGKVYFDERLIYSFDLLPEAGHKRPAFINLQQFHLEQYLVSRIRALQAQGACIDLRGRNKVIGVINRGDRALLSIDTPEGQYDVSADYAIACDGASSPMRSMLGLPFKGRYFEDNFLIADIKIDGDLQLPAERRFWFDPPFNRGQSALLHKQPDDIWRVDLQLGWNINRERELQSEKIVSRIKAFLGENLKFELDWVSIYTFQCRRMEAFRHGCIFFAGDSAHQVSPFGARGANSGLQDVDNLIWKLSMVIHGEAPDSLLETYDVERKFAADENILNSARSTDFITPKSEMSRLFRDSVLDLAEHHPFARPMVNSGRLSLPTTYDDLSSATFDEPTLPRCTRPGAPATDAPLTTGWLIDRLGNGFHLLAINTDLPGSFDSRGITITCSKLSSDDDPTGLLKDRYLGQAASAIYVIRPDQHIAARWTECNPGQVAKALAKAAGVQSWCN